MVLLFEVTELYLGGWDAFLRSVYITLDSVLYTICNSVWKFSRVNFCEFLSLILVYCCLLEFPLTW